MNIVEYLSKARNKLTGIAGKGEGAPRVKIHMNAKTAAKKLPNSGGQKTLQQPKFGQIAGAPSARKAANAQPPSKEGRPSSAGRPIVPHGNYITNHWRRGMKIEYEMKSTDAKGKSKGNKGIARIRDFGSKGVRAISESGQVLHLFHSEVLGQYHEEKEGAKKK